jgi:hypothetical protein
MNFDHIKETLESFGVINYAIFSEPTSQDELFETIKIAVGADATGTVIYENHISNYPFTFEQFKEKLEEIKKDYSDKEYQRSRALEYPSIKEQLDMLWHAIDEDALNKTSDFYTALKSIKDQYPKS